PDNRAIKIKVLHGSVISDDHVMKLAVIHGVAGDQLPFGSPEHLDIQQTVRPDINGGHVPAACAVERRQILLSQNSSAASRLKPDRKRKRCRAFTGSGHGEYGLLQSDIIVAAAAETKTGADFARGKLHPSN